MTCGGCVAKVKSELLKLPDVTSADVQLNSPQAIISMRNHISTARLQQAIGTGKFTITDIGTGMEQSAEIDEAKSDSYYPIFLIFGYIAGITLLIEFLKPKLDVMEWMQYFMAGFFLVFSFFKLLNLNGFAEGYSTYDVVAKRIKGYGFVYPFIELTLGIALLAGFNPLVTNLTILLVMSVGTIGVAQSLLKKTNFQCACLGTIIKLPLSKVTLFEDLLMIVMSAVTISQLL